MLDNLRFFGYNGSYDSECKAHERMAEWYSAHEIPKECQDKWTNIQVMEFMYQAYENSVKAGIDPLSRHTQRDHVRGSRFIVASVPYTVPSIMRYTSWELYGQYNDGAWANNWDAKDSVGYLRLFGVTRDPKKVVGWEMDFDRGNFSYETDLQVGLDEDGHMQLQRRPGHYCGDLDYSGTVDLCCRIAKVGNKWIMDYMSGGDEPPWDPDFSDLQPGMRITPKEADRRHMRWIYPCVEDLASMDICTRQYE